MRHYQRTLLHQLAQTWEGHRRVLDIGGGDGTIAQAMHDHFGCEVVSIDVVDRFATGLTIETAIYDGIHLRFEDDAFDAITFNNVLHHVPVASRPSLIRECQRVCCGTIYVKDHLPIGALDHLRLFCLDVIGNLPHGGMVKASYLSEQDWHALFSDYERTALPHGGYRTGVFAVIFPDRLETFMKFRVHCSTEVPLVTCVPLSFTFADPGGSISIVNWFA